VERIEGNSGWEREDTSGGNWRRERGGQRQKGDSKRTLGVGCGRERIPEALSFNQIHYTEFIAARELIKCRRINSRRSKAECLHEI